MIPTLVVLIVIILFDCVSDVGPPNQASSSDADKSVGSCAAIADDGVVVSSSVPGSGISNAENESILEYVHTPIPIGVSILVDEPSTGVESSRLNCKCNDGATVG